jgi:hypothetical protein
MRSSLVGGLSAFALVLIGCAVSQDPPYETANSGAVGPTGTGGTGESGGTPNATPILVDVDDGATMTAQPGQGVGVFTEYVSGGHWHVWWTCDTTQTNETCPMSVTVSLAGKGQISNPVADVSSSATPVVNAAANAVSATTITTTGIDGMTFDTDAGAIITLTATVGGVYDGSFLFFVQDGNINGNYAGTITDPLMLEGKSP